jgi:hypothetical protein
LILVVESGVKRYRTPLDLQGLEFVEVWKQFFIVRVGEALGHEGGIADGPLRGPTGIATAQPGIWIRLEQGPILALPHLRVQLHNLLPRLSLEKNRKSGPRKSGIYPSKDVGYVLSLALSGKSCI